MPLTFPLAWNRALNGGHWGNNIYIARLSAWLCHIPLVCFSLREILVNCTKSMEPDYCHVQPFRADTIRCFATDTLCTTFIFNNHAIISNWAVVNKCWNDDQTWNERTVRTVNIHKPSTFGMRVEFSGWRFHWHLRRCKLNELKEICFWGALQ